VLQASEKPVPLAYLADRAQKALGHAKTIGTNWAGSGGFLNFLSQNLPEPFRLTEKPPYFVYDPARHRLREDWRGGDPVPSGRPSGGGQGSSTRLAELQRSIARIYDACQAPPLPPSEYQLLFTLIASEIREHGFSPERTPAAVVARAAEAGLKLGLKDVAFVVQAVDEVDPWFEHTRSPAAVARAYRDYVLTRCSRTGLRLTDDEHQLIQVWFGASQWSGANRGGEARETEAPSRELPDTRPSERELPAPPDLGGLPVPTRMEEEQRLEADAKGRENALRYSFLKHG
jgi:hypothetical protein